MLTRLIYSAIAVLVVLIGFSTEIWGRDADLPVYLFLAMVVLVAGLTLASVAGMTAPRMDIKQISGIVSDMVVDPAAEGFIIPSQSKSGRTRGFTSCRIDGERVFIRNVANLVAGDRVIAAGIPGADFEMLAVRDRNGICALPEAGVLYDRPEGEIALGIASLLVLIGFPICFRVKQNYDLTMSWRDAVRRATEMIQDSPVPGQLARF